MKKVLTSLLISIALAASAHSLWACATLVTADGQPMTPNQTAAVNAQLAADRQAFYQDMRGVPDGIRRAELGDPGNFPTQQQAYNELLANGTLPPRDPGSAPPTQPAPAPVNGVTQAPPTPPAPPPVVPIGTQTIKTTTTLADFNHDPTADLIVPQIDLVPDLSDNTMPDSGTKQEVM